MSRGKTLCTVALLCASGLAQTAPFGFHFEYDQGQLPNTTTNVAVGNLTGYPTPLLWNVSCGKLQQRTGSNPAFGSFFYGGSFSGYPATAVTLNGTLPMILEARFAALLLTPGGSSVTGVLLARHTHSITLAIDLAAGLIMIDSSSGFLSAAVPGGLFIPHTYRIETIPSGGSNTVTLFVDGVATLGPATAATNLSTSVNGWAFGDSSGGPQGVDLDWSYVTIINGPSGGVGQRNSDTASLFVNRAANAATGAPGLNGPFPVTTWGGSTVKLEWNGPAGMPFLLLAGPATPGAGFFGCTGTVDLGTPPLFADVVTVFSPSTPFWGSLFQLDYCGYSQQTFLVPPVPPSTPLANIQGAVFQPSGCGIVLTAAFYLTS